MTEDTGLFDPPEIPEGHIPLNMVMVVSYLDAEGERAYSTHIRGTSTIGDVLGLLELGKDDVLAERRRTLND